MDFFRFLKIDRNKIFNNTIAHNYLETLSLQQLPAPKMGHYNDYTKDTNRKYFLIR